jgi:teichoic acid transport system permease protein
MSIFNKIITLMNNIWCDRRLLISLSKKDFVRKFSGTYFGIAWAFVQPLLTIIVYWTVFQFGFRSGDVGETPFVLWFICGIVPWLFISEAFSIASNSFIEYNYLIKKVKFNINILPLVKILSSFYVHIFFVGIITIVCMGFNYFPKIYYIQIIYYMFSAVALIFALSLITSSITVFFRDLNQIINVILLIGMWGTPIAWNLTIFDSPKLQFILKMNPFYYLIEGYRDCILGRGWFWERPMLSIYYWFCTLILFICGISIYLRLKSHFADTV